MWAHIHADYWQDENGNLIHRAKVDEKPIYHCKMANSHLPWNGVFMTLAKAKGFFQCQSKQ